VIKIILFWVGGIFGTLAAFLYFIDVLKREKNETIHAWLRAWAKAIWKFIEDSQWIIFPEKIIKWFLQINEEFILDSLLKIYKTIKPIYIFVVWIILFFVGCWISLGLYVSLISLFATISVILFFRSAKLVLRIFSLPILPKSLEHKMLYFFGKQEHLLIFRTATLMFGISLAFWIFIILKLNIYVATIAILLQVAVYLYIIAFPLAIFYFYFRYLVHPGSTRRISFFVNKLSLITLGTSISAALTILALFLGHILVTDARIPLNLNMIISNILFDSITVVTTFMILKWALVRNTLLRIPIAIVVDFFIASFLACCSLYFGLIFAENSLSISEIMNVFTAKSPDGSSHEIGPFFWAMHTTFVPTFMYLSILLIYWIRKAFLIPVRWFFSVGRDHDNPLRLTAALFTLFSVIFFVMYTMLSN